MSTSVYKPINIFQSRTPVKMLLCMPEVRKVKRVLFEPADHAATQKFIDEELKKITVTESERWNFDFKRERTLNPNGVYNWRPVTPKKAIRPIKKVAILEDFEVEDLYGYPQEIIRPIPIEAGVEDDMKTSPRSQKSQPQRLITDFMPVKKRSLSEASKKNERTSSMERPSKLPRLADLSS